jgi:hypothetical protein
VNALTVALAATAAWALASLPFGILAARLFRTAHRERAIDLALADPAFWDRLEQELRQP